MGLYLSMIIINHLITSGNIGPLPYRLSPQEEDLNATFLMIYSPKLKLKEK